MQDCRRQIKTLTTSDTQKRQPWVDLLRGFAMMAILLDHTEIYFTGDNVIPYNLYVADVLMLFFFLSGYLFLKPGHAFSIQHKTKSILRSLLLPYFVFTLLLAVPKFLFHEGEMSMGQIAASILLGQASWFVAALIVAELLFALAIHFSCERLLPLAFFALLSLLLAIVFNHLSLQLPWQVENALLAVPFLFLGYTFHHYESSLTKRRKTVLAIILLVLFLTAKLLVIDKQISLLVNPLRISNFIIFLTSTLSFIFLLIVLARQLPECKWLQWVGRHSLVYYFFCGAAPALVTFLLRRLGLSYTGNYLLVLLAFSLVVALTTIIAFLIYHYLPKLVGKTRK